MIAVALHEASIAERAGAKVLLEKVGDWLPRMEKIGPTGATTAL